MLCQPDRTSHTRQLPINSRFAETRLQTLTPYGVKSGGFPLGYHRGGGLKLSTAAINSMYSSCSPSVTTGGAD